MFACPNCRRRLVRTKTEHGLFYVCPGCRGRAAALTVLRRAIGPEPVKGIWRDAQRQRAEAAKKCPVCEQRMRTIPASPGGEEFPLDVCARCQFVWFDAQEFERFPAAPRPLPGRPDRELPEKAREQIALGRIEVEKLRDSLAPSDEVPGLDEPEEAWKWGPALLGMPIEEEVPGLRSWPWATWTLAALLVAVFALTVANLEPIVDALGLVPRDLFRVHGATLLTSFFLHGGLLHLVGNVYFLLIFGDNVEDYLGRVRYLLLLVGAALAGDLLHVALDPRSEVPCIGASGGISGVIVFYALKFPHARLGFLMRVYYYFRWIYMPAYVALIFWIVLQCLTAWLQVHGAGSVSAAAHLGGAALGLVAWLAWGDPRGSSQTD